MNLTQRYEVRLPKRASRFGVGKLMGNDIYAHTKYQGEIIPEEILTTALEKKPEDFKYDIIKHNLKTGNITFIQSPDFDTSPEPTVGNQFLVKIDGSSRPMKAHANPWIYHHKWLFVKDDYPGFNVEESKKRSEQWMALPDIDYKRIGKKSFWENNVLTKI